MAKRYSVSARLEAEDKASGTVAKVEGRFAKLRGVLDRFVITAGDVANAVRSVIDTVSSWVEAAGKAEEAQAALRVALEKQGAANESTIAGLNDQANALAALTAHTNDQVTAGQALLAQLGVAADRIPDATQAAVDLSASLGISLDAAFRNIGRTMGGFAGELGELVPELRDLTREQLLNGDAIDLLLNKYRGAGQAIGATFGQQLQGLGNDLRELGEALVKGATDSGSIEEGLAKVRETVRSLIPVMEDLGRGLDVLAKRWETTEEGAKTLDGAFLNLVDNIPQLVVVLGQNAEAQAKLTLENQRAAQAEELLARVKAGELTVGQALAIQRGQEAAASAAAAEGARVLAAGMFASAAATEAAGNASAEAAPKLAAFGAEQAQHVTQADRIAAAMEQQRAAITSAAASFDEGAISLGEYQAAVTAAHTRLAELRAEMEKTAPATAALDAAMKAAGLSVEDTAAKEEQLRAVIEQADAALQANAITHERHAAIVSAANAAIAQLTGTTEVLGAAAFESAGALDSQAESLDRVARSAGSAADGLERLVSAQRATLDGARGEAVGITLEEIRRIQGRLGGGFQSGAGLGGGAGGAGFGGSAIRVRPDGTRAVA